MHVCHCLDRGNPLVIVLCPTLWRRKIPPVIVVLLRSNNDASCCPPPPSLLRYSQPPAPLQDDISVAVVTTSSSSHCPLSSCHLTPAQVAASAKSSPSLDPSLLPQPPPHRQMTMSSLAMMALLPLVRGTSSPTLAVADAVLPPPPYLSTSPPKQHVDCHFHTTALLPWQHRAPQHPMCLLTIIAPLRECTNVVFLPPPLLLA